MAKKIKNSRPEKRHTSILFGRCVVAASTMLAVFLSGTLVAAPDAFSINSDSPSENADSLYIIDLATGSHNRVGTVTSFGQTRIDVEGLALAPDGTLYGVDDSATTLFPISTATGRAVATDEVAISGVPTNGGNDFGMTFACDGNLYLTSVVTQTLYSMNLEGEATPIGVPGSLGDDISAIAAYGSPVRLYGLGNGLDGGDGVASRTLYEINTSTGTVSPIGQLGGQALDYHEAGLAFDETGNLWAITDRRAVPGGPFPSQILRVNTSTGLATAVGSTQETGFESLSISVPRGCTDGGSGDVARFTATKRFMDRNDREGVSLTLSCNTGLPLEQTRVLQPNTGSYEDFEITFVVRDFESGELDCQLSEGPVSGYTGTYNCGGVSACSAGDPSSLDDNFAGPCQFTDVGLGDENSCFIRNYVNPVNVDVTKQWLDENEEFQGLTVAEMSWACINARSSGSDLTLETESGEIGFTMSEETQSFEVYPNFDPDQPTVCSVTEDYPGLGGEVEADDSDCQGLTVSPGNGAACTVINTRFYAGIPTLDTYGKILMALLLMMLGLFATRRFA